MSLTSDAERLMDDALAVARRAGVPVWHHHVPERILLAIESGDLASVEAMVGRCGQLADVHLLDAAEKERGLPPPTVVDLERQAP